MAASTSFDIESPPKVVVLEDDYCTIMPIMLEIIEKNLEWEIEFVKTGDEATKKKAPFYILDIKLGEGKRKQEGINTAEIIKAINASSFVSLFSGIPQLSSLTKQARRIGVDYIEEKSNLKINVCNIAIEMLLHLENLLLNCLKQELSSGNTELAESFVKKLEEINEKTKVIYKLEQSYHNDSTDHPVLVSADTEPLKLYSDDENVQAYERKCEKDKEWFKKYEGKYVAFADGQWLGEAFVADSKNELFKLLDESNEYKDKALFYTCVKNNDILEGDIESLPRLSSAVQMRNWKF